MALLALGAFSGALAVDTHSPIPGQFVVRLSAKTSAAAVSQSLGPDRSLTHPSDLTVDPNRPKASLWGRTYLIRTDDPSMTVDLLTQEIGSVNIDYIEPVYPVVMDGFPTDPYFPVQWHLVNIGQECPAVMRVEGEENDTLGLVAGTPGADIALSDYYASPPDELHRVVVAVVDTGIDPNHPDLEGVIWHNPDEIPGNGIDDDHNGFVDDTIGYDLSGDSGSIIDIHGDNDPSDYLGHGTHIAGIIAAQQNDIGVTGIIPSAQIMAVKMQPNGTTAVGAAAIVYAVNSGAEVINVSWGTTFESLILRDALEFAEANGVLVCMSSGNSGGPDYHYPGAFDYGLTVGATQSNGHLTTFSTYGPFVDLVAPGMDILSLRAEGTDMYGEKGEPGVHIVGADSLYYLSSGTSMAAPMVAGAAALLKSVRPHLDYNQLIDELLGGARDIIDPYNEGDSLPGYDEYTGYGSLNVRSSLAISHNPGIYFVSPQSGSRVEGGAVIRAAAVSGYTGGWQLDYASSSDPTDWHSLGSGSVMPGDSTLTTFDAGGQSGRYVVRMTDDFGREHFLLVTLVVDSRLELTSPVSEQELDYNVPIAGSVYGQGYQKLSLYFSYEGNPRELVYETGAEVFDSLIYSWNASGSVLGNYTLYAEALFDDGLLADSVHFVIESAFAEGWPQALLGRGALSPAAADLDGDGTIEVVAGTLYGLNVFGSDGQPRAGFPVLVGTAVRSIPALYDVDRDGRLEIICTSEGSLHVFNDDGSYADGWPMEYSLGYTAYGTPTPVVTELGNNADSAIVVISDEGEVIAYEFDGRPYFYSLEGHYASFNASPVQSTYYNGNAVSSADLDGDGANEVVVSYSAEDPTAGVAVLDGRTAQPAFDRILPYCIEAKNINGTVLADLTGDGLPEIITSGFDNLGRGVLWVKTNGFDDLPGWPVVIPEVDNWIGTYPTVADLDRDGSPEILATFYEFDLGILYAFKADGTPYRTLDGHPAGQAYRQAVTFGPPIVADLMGDEHPEVIIRGGHILPNTGREEIHVLDYGLESVPGWPIATPTPLNQVFSTGYAPLVDDVDGDGLVEVALVGEGGMLYIWNYEASVADGANVGRLFMDNMNSSILPHERVVTDVEIGNPETPLPVTFSLSQNYPNPFNPATRISFDLPRRTNARLDVFNILGQQVLTLIDEVLPPGSHTVEFDGRELASGVYLYRLKTADFTSTRKMVLLK